MTHAFREIGVALFPAALRMQRREPPVLSLRENRIRRRAAGCRERKDVLMTPGIIAVTVRAQWQIQIQCHTVRPGLFSNSGHLFLRQPLDIKVILLQLPGGNPLPAIHPGEVVPAIASTIRHAAPARRGTAHNREPADASAETVQTRRRRAEGLGKKCAGQPLQHFTLERHLRGIIHERRLPQCLQLILKRKRLHQ